VSRRGFISFKELAACVNRDYMKDGDHIVNWDFQDREHHLKKGSSRAS
jgi:hypothetical protein